MVQAELGKTKAVEALRTKEAELTALKKKNSRLLKESTKEGKARVKAELDKKVLIDQIRALKKHNAQLALRSKEVRTGGRADGCVVCHAVLGCGVPCPGHVVLCCTMLRHILSIVDYFNGVCLVVV